MQEVNLFKLKEYIIKLVTTVYDLALKFLNFMITLLLLNYCYYFVAVFFGCCRKAKKKNVNIIKGEYRNLSKETF